MKYIWSQFVLPAGIPIGVLMAAIRFEKVGLSWRDVLTPTGAATAYCYVVGSVLLSAAWGLLDWRRNVRDVGEGERRPTDHEN